MWFITQSVEYLTKNFALLSTSLNTFETIYEDLTRKVIFKMETFEVLTTWIFFTLPSNFRSGFFQWTKITSPSTVIPYKQSITDSQSFVEKYKSNATSQFSSIFYL